MKKSTGSALLLGCATAIHTDQLSTWNGSVEKLSIAQ